MLIDCIRKDSSLSDTIRRIRTILKKNSIKVSESFFSLSDFFFSARVELTDFPGIGSNGKGFTKKAALASAYAELMERLQAGFLLRSFFLNKDDFFLFQREEHIKKADLIKVAADLFSAPYKKKIGDLADVASIYTSSDFINAFSGEVILLPNRLINIVCKTNGLCAGNTYEEAVVQGICEILERYVHRKIILEDLSLPDIPEEELTSKYITSALEQIKKLGLRYRIKDCSLNGRYPVIGLLLSNKDDSKAIFTVGADIDQNIALSRCMLEIFQGLNSKKAIYTKLQPIVNLFLDKEHTWYEAYTYNRSHVSVKLFQTEQKNSKWFSVPKTALLNNKDALSLLLKKLRKENRKVFVKDYSYLGFPTYRVFIPKMSEVNPLSEADLYFYKNLATIRGAYFNLQHSSSEALKKFINFIEIYNHNFKTDRLDLFNTTGLINSPFSDMKYDFLRLFSLIRLEDYKTFQSILNSKDYSNISPKIKKDLISLIKDVKYPNKEDEFIRYFKLKNFFPNCPDCNMCPLIKKCHYKKWYKYLTCMHDRYLGWMLWNNCSNCDASIFIEELKPEMTQCRLVQVEKKIGSA